MRAIRMAILSIGVALLFGLVPAAVSHAQTLPELQAQLNQLLQQLSSLQQQQASGVVPNASPIAAPISSSSCFYTNRPLRLGSQGDDVVALQRFLAADSSLYPEGTVSGYFGALTQAAVQRFQIRYGIVSSGAPDSTGFGAVGPATRNKISMLCGSSGGGTVGGGTVVLPPSQASCFVGGLTIPSGGTIQMYSINSASLGASCTLYGQIRQCINGILTGSPSYQYTSCSSATVPIRLGCTVGSVSMAEGETRTFFLNQLVPYGGTCTWQGRTCLNGTLSGGSGFQYTSCVVSTVPSSCTQDGVTISHGQSATFYAEKNVNFGQFCANFAATRTCNNGTLGGNSTYQYSTCSAAGAHSCTYKGVTIAHGADKTFYSVQSVAYNQKCTDLGRSVVGHCNDGNFIIPAQYTYATCTVTPEKTCSLDGITYPGGTSRTFYSTGIAPTGHACTEYDQIRKCTNGVWNGSAAFNKAVCAAKGHAYCRLGSTYIADKKTITAYYQSVVPFGNTCSQYDQVRTCNNGTLSGSYPYASCKADGANACNVNGGSVAHNTSATLYSTDKAPDGETCAMNSELRTCYNGDLSGDDAFIYKTCAN